jgi:hypothetical protein
VKRKVSTWGCNIIVRTIRDTVLIIIRTYLISKDRHAYVALVIDAWVVNLGRELHLGRIKVYDAYPLDNTGRVPMGP